MRRLCRSIPVDLIHAHNYEGLLAALAAGKRPVVYHAHNAMSDELPYYFSRRKTAARFGGWLDRTFPRRADHIIAPHSRLKDYLIEQGCRADRISVIPPCVDPAQFAPAPVREALPPVLYTGNLDVYQNLDFLYRVMARVQRRVPEARLLMATADRRFISGVETVITSDFHATARLLEKDAVVVCPRVAWSGFPIKLLNAMAAGQAVVGCQGAAHPLRHRYNGLVTPDNDEEAFAEAILTLLQDKALRMSLGTQARLTIVERYSPMRCAEEISAVYGACMARCREEARDGGGIR